jgi:Uma2 family endonuclease
MTVGAGLYQRLVEGSRSAGTDIVFTPFPASAIIRARIRRDRRGDQPMATVEALMTAEEFGQRPDSGHPEELVQGKVVEMTPPDRRHGYVCYKACRILGSWVDEHDLGRVLSNDSGVITERDPDTVRGADVAYYSYARLSREPLSSGYGPEVPELVVEVRSTHDRWRNVLEKVIEYLDAGVLVVVVLDPESRSAHVYRDVEEPMKLGPDEELTFPGLLEGFSARVGRFFE